MKLNWNSKETQERFREVVALLCAGDYPPVDMVNAWLTTDDETLQSWCIREAGLSYLTGISILEASVLLVEEAFGNANIDENGNFL